MHLGEDAPRPLYSIHKRAASWIFKTDAKRERRSPLRPAQMRRCCVPDSLLQTTSPTHYSMLSPQEILQSRIMSPHNQHEEEETSTVAKATPRPAVGRTVGRESFQKASRVSGSQKFLKVAGRARQGNPDKVLSHSSGSMRHSRQDPCVC